MFFTDAQNESNVSMIVATKKTSSECYYCTDCPYPFDPLNKAVSKLSSSTGRCYVC